MNRIYRGLGAIMVGVAADRLTLGVLLRTHYSTLVTMGVSLLVGLAVGCLVLIWVEEGQKR